MPLTSPLTEPALREACLAARKVARRAYAPYSKFRVGAAVVGKRGLYCGANVENASYGLTLCAERAALAAAVAAGDRDIRAVVLAFLDAPRTGEGLELVPCGACRQWIAELAPPAGIYIWNTRKWYTPEALLPVAFSLPTGERNRRRAAR